MASRGRASALFEWIDDNEEDGRDWSGAHDQPHSPLRLVKRADSLSRKENGSNFWDDFPPELDDMADAIRLSRDITEMEDEDGSSLCSEETWQRAMNFLARQALWLLTERSRVMPTPDIWAGPDRSIDLHWESATHELLINIRADLAQPAGFYGDDKGKLKIKGTLDPSTFNEGLLLWLENRGDRLA